MPRIAVFGPLVDKDRHDSESVVGLEEQVLHRQDPSGVMQKRRGIVYRSTKVARGAGSVFKEECVIAAVPFQVLLTYSERVAIRRGNHGAVRHLAALIGRIIKPN